MATAPSANKVSAAGKTDTGSRAASSPKSWPPRHELFEEMEKSPETPLGAFQLSLDFVQRSQSATILALQRGCSDGNT